MTRTSFALFALAFGAVPLSAQISTTDRVRDRVIVATDGRVGGRTGETRTNDETRPTDGMRERNSRIPPGQLPPRGKCRVWIDEVPPGMQPPVTDCATAERNRTANSRVIYGDRESFRGRANGKFKDREKQRECQIRDGVVIDGRVVNVCSDDEARARRRAGELERRDRDDDDDDDDRWEKREKAGRKLEKQRAKEVRKAQKKGNRDRD